MHFHCYWHFLYILWTSEHFVNLLCSTESRNSFRFGTAWGWVNDDNIWVNYPFGVHKYTKWINDMDQNCFTAEFSLLIHNTVNVLLFSVGELKFQHRFINILLTFLQQFSIKQCFNVFPAMKQKHTFSSTTFQGWRCVTCWLVSKQVHF